MNHLLRIDKFNTIHKAFSHGEKMLSLGGITGSVKSDYSTGGYYTQELLEYNHCHQISLLNKRNFPGMSRASDQGIAIEPEPLNPGLCPLCIYSKIRESDDQTSVRHVTNVFSKVI